MLAEQKIVNFLFAVANNHAFRKQVRERGINLFHFSQLKTGNMNLHSVEKAIFIALRTCIRKYQKN